MGKGDRRTKKGKIVRGTFGVSRPKRIKADYVAETKVEPKKESKKTTTKKTSKKAEAK